MFVFWNVFFFSISTLSIYHKPPDYFLEALFFCPKSPHPSVLPGNTPWHLLSSKTERREAESERWGRSRPVDPSAGEARSGPQAAFSSPTCTADSTWRHCTSSPPCCASPVYCPQSRSCRTASHTGAGSSPSLHGGTKGKMSSHKRHRWMKICLFFFTLRQTWQNSDLAWENSHVTGIMLNPVTCDIT